MRQGHGEFESGLGYIPKPCLKTKGNEDGEEVEWKEREVYTLNQSNL